ncbi:YecA family protein [Thiobacter aerophilum]|uniref:YecA family protein n=1 Tax=Thiobacter aerophilum TaxID=3121275 RepID=A0ABV0EE74_9BURK
MLPIPSRPLDGAELARLEQFLRSHACGPDAMGVSRAHGFLTAGVCGPESLSPEEWIRLVFDEPVFASGEQAQDMLGLALALYRDIEHGLAAGDFRPVLEYVRAGGGAVYLDPRSWCEGFIAGTNLFREHWTGAAREMLQDALDVIFRLARLKPDGGSQHARLCQALPLAAEAVYAFWREERRDST